MADTIELPIQEEESKLVILEADPLDFMIRFANKKQESIVYISSDDLGKLSEALSKFFTSIGIENRLVINDLVKKEEIVNEI